MIGKSTRKKHQKANNHQNDKTDNDQENRPGSGNFFFFSSGSGTCPSGEMDIVESCKKFGFPDRKITIPEDQILRDYFICVKILLNWAALQHIKG